jgi:hypothetical protein
MKKLVLAKFIEKYNLSGMNESVVWDIKSNTMHTTFSSEDRTLVGSIKCNSIELDDATFGIDDTTHLSKILNVMNEDIEMKLNTNGEKINSFVLSDNVFNSKFVVVEPSTIPKAGKVATIPEFELIIKIDAEFISKFLSAKNALPEANVFAIKSYDNIVEIIMNYSNNNVNTITYNIDGKSNINFQPTLFSAEKVKSILVANKYCDNGVLSISQGGISEYKFIEKNYTSTYYLVKTTLIN